MAFKIIKKVPSSKQIIQEIPLSQNSYKKITQNRLEIENILAGVDKRILLIIGPCSAWPYEAAIEYAKRLQKINQQVKNNLKLVMRVYIQKPRTIRGWTGPVNQPDPKASPDIESGIRYARKLMVEIAEMGLPIADEALFTHNAQGFIELLSWVAIGARSSEDQEHRIFASSVDCPVGMKNPTHGSLKIAVNGVISAQHSHRVIFDGNEIETDGNPYVHIVLRGGQELPNYSIKHLEEVKGYLEKGEVKNPAIMIDVSHDNCLVNGVKDYQSQPEIIFNILKNLKDRPELKQLVKGFMLESFIKEGNQKVEIDKAIDMDGLSITDPCISWEQTEAMLIELSQYLETNYWI